MNGSESATYTYISHHKDTSAMFDYSFRTAGRTFLASLVVVFVLLSYMWVSAAHADTRCDILPSGVVLCEGAGWQLPSAPRGTVKHRPAISARHRAQAAAVSARQARLTHTVARVGTTVVIARLGR